MKLKKWLFSAFLIPMLCYAQSTFQGNSLTVDSAPAASSQASASIGADQYNRHVADMICFSGGATTAPTLTALTVVLRDGASGAGTVKASFVVVVPASTGENVAPFCAQFVNGIKGSANTAMTAEWSGALSNEIEQVTLYYHNQ